MKRSSVRTEVKTRLALSVCGVLGLGGVVAFGQSSFRGTWADAFHIGYKNASQVDQLVGYAVQGNYNAIIAEVLAYQDTGGTGHGAYWNSQYVPKAADISESDFDPLAYLCQQAHAQGIEVHAWLVTYRVSTSWPPSGNSILTSHPEWIMVERADTGGGPSPIGDAYCLDPGSPDVQNYLIEIVRELVTNYPIDGINWDYIRYTQTDGGYPADSNYYYSGLKRFQRIYNRSDVPSTSDSSWCTFRRRTIDELVRRCRAEIPNMPSSRQPVRLTADVLAAGNYTGNFASSTAYTYFQNWKYWQEMAWLDATIPMNYKREHCTDQAQWYRNWVNASVSWKNGRHVFCGQAGYLNIMPNSITQLAYALNQGSDGTASYSYYATTATEGVCESPTQDPWANDWSWYPYVAANLFTSPVAIPGMPWRNPATATDGTIWGRIVDSATSLPVDDASVTVGSRPVSKTDANGYYVVTLLPATGSGTSYNISVTKSGLPSGSYTGAKAVAGEVRQYDITLGSLAPQLVLNGSGTSIVLTRSVGYGGELADETFTVSAFNWPTYGPVNYQINDDSSWLSVSPSYGTSSGEEDTIAIDYSTAGLPAGEYTGMITVSDPKASNTPLTITINLTVVPPPVPGDFDGDYDVDQVDFARMQNCLSGATVPQNAPDCQGAKLDGDSDVDYDDMQLFAGCFSGPGVPGDPDCLNP
ncbi:MAG TPA: family 10 glycosylhydrolase [Phycisphaerae bacterium]|nr:family 10 glycosylhydrolase [Phycisphaerae bacterium]HRR85089.1 family 10 glycosylhydrolase [Phycisphaerae bacterium]